MTSQVVMLSKIHIQTSLAPSRNSKYHLTVTCHCTHIYHGRHFDQIHARPLHTRAADRITLDGADVTPERMMLSLSACTPAATDLSQRPATIPVVPDLVDLIRQHIISRCIHRDAYSRGPMAILVLNAPASLRRLVVPLNGLVEREHPGSA